MFDQNVKVRKKISFRKATTVGQLRLFSVESFHWNIKLNLDEFWIKNNRYFVFLASSPEKMSKSASSLEMQRQGNRNGMR